ncbi:adenosine kinase [Candidatus Woesearchaeota archaeon]|nr:adenosine kinase [Candidatus Woesearchaeota archaeon]
MKSFDVIGLGNAIVDLLVEVDDHALLGLDLRKGEMHLVDVKKAQMLLHHVKELKIEVVPGGSSANTVKGVAFLGGKSILVGKVGKDRHGEIYVKEMGKCGVHSRIGTHDSLTGHALTFITPDAQRTFCVHLGAAISLQKEDVLEEDIAKSKVLHLEGYQLEGPTRETILHAMELAKKHGTLVSVDLADPGLIRRNKEWLKLLLKKADIVFVNEQEAKEFTGFEEEKAVMELGKQARMAVVKLGERGSLIWSDGKVVTVPAFPAKALDTTGAGDSYAAGFLYGFCQGWDVMNAGKLGSLLAARVVERKGVRFDGLDAERMKKEALS